MHEFRDRARTILTVALVAIVSACGGGGGGAPNPGPTTPPPTQYGTLTISADNADIIGLAVALAEGVLSVAQVAANEVVVFSSSAGAAYRDCYFGGSATIVHVDADTNFAVSAGDSLTIAFDECQNDLVNGEITGVMEIAITAYDLTASTVSLSAVVDISNPLSIADAVDPALNVEVTAQMSVDFSLDPAESLIVRPSGSPRVSVTTLGVTESISDYEISRTVQADFAGAQAHEVDMAISFDFLYDSALLGGTATCETDPQFTLVRRSIDAANVLCRGSDSSGIRSDGTENVSLDPDGDGTFALWGTISWFQVFDGFFYEPSGLNLDDLFGDVATRTIALVATDVFYDANRDRLLVTTASTDTFSPDSLVSVSISQNSQNVLETFGTEPSAVAVSTDGSLAYVGLGSNGEVRKYDATSLQLQSTLTIASNDPASSQYDVLDLAVSPTDPQTVAVSFNYVGTGANDVAIFTGDTQLPGRARNAPGGSFVKERVLFSSDGIRVHSYYLPSSGGSSTDLVLDASGVAQGYENYRRGLDLAIAGDRIYSSGGWEFDAQTHVKLGTFDQGGRHVAVDTANKLFYSESFDTFKVLDLERRLPIASVELGFDSNSVNRIESAGDFVVFVTDNDLRVVDVSSIERAAAEDCGAVSGQTVSGNAYTQFSCDVTDAVYDPMADRIYAAVTSELPGNGNSIAVINHNTNSVETYIPVPSNPKRLALSADSTRLYVAFQDAELLVVVDTATRAIANTWQIGDLTPRTGYNELDPKIVLQLATSPLEADTVVALTAEASNSIEKDFVAFRDGARLADELPISALKSNTSFPYPRAVFDDTGTLFALHVDDPGPYFETMSLTTTGLASTGAWFDAVGAVWWPTEASVDGTGVYMPQGDVVDVVNQTVERRFDYTDAAFADMESPDAVYSDRDSDDVWFLLQANFMSTGLARFDDQTGTLSGADEFPFVVWGRNFDFSHASIFNVGSDKLGLVIDEREGVIVIDKDF